MNTKPLWEALALATALALTGCSTSGGPAAGTDADTASTRGAQAMAETTEDQSTEAVPGAVADFGIPAAELDDVPLTYMVDFEHEDGLSPAC